MSRWIRAEQRAEWGALLSAYQSSSFRLEAQQTYGGADVDERLARFLAGDPIIPTFEWRLNRARERIAAGCTKITVRVVVEPQTDYTRMELLTYPIIAAGGEDIRVIPVAEGHWPDGLPRHDFFLFDDTDVWRMHYHDDFSFEGAEMLEGAEVLAEYQRWRDIALDLALPLHDYPHVEPLPS